MNNANKAQIKEANRLARIVFEHETGKRIIPNYDQVKRQYLEAFDKLG